jgi:MFS family permease
MFFLHGLCFASWASRIPSIQQHLNLSSSRLGELLFILPAGFFSSSTVAGWIIARAGSKITVIFSGMIYSVALVGIGWSDNLLPLIFSLFSFGFFGNLLNISINTQAVAVEALSGKKLMASFHGMWSLAGFAGAAIGSGMIALRITPSVHFTLINIVFLIGTGLISFHLVSKDINTNERRPAFSRPDPSILGLGIIAFCSMMVEGAMFDWSGIYFVKVVKVTPQLTGIGYTTFMIAMAVTRFTADRLSSRFGLKRMLQLSGMFAAAGLAVTISIPVLSVALPGFFIIGIGVSSVVPLVFSEVGRSKKLSPGSALSAVASLGFLGLLIGPPVIGFIAQATSLRISFLALLIMALAVFVLASRSNNPNA